MIKSVGPEKKNGKMEKSESRQNARRLELGGGKMANLVGALKG